MDVKVVLVDINAKMIKAWRETFEENPEVEIVQGSMLERVVDAWVSPTNSKGSMDGGLDGVIKGHLGGQIEKRLKKEIKQVYHGSLPIGHATVIPSKQSNPKFLISTPTMHSSSEDVSDSMNTALACAAAFQAVHIQNTREPGSISSVALPGLGANTGQVPVEICADLMWTGYQLFRARACPDFQSMRAALEQELGDLSPMDGEVEVPKAKLIKKASSSSPKASKAPPPSVKDADVDFDDFD